MFIENKDIEEARKILGNITKELTDDELKDSLVEIQYLIESWLDDYERSIFSGQTLNELLSCI